MRTVTNHANGVLVRALNLEPDNRMHGSTGGGWKRNAGSRHRASPRPIPVEKYRLVGDTRTIDWATGLPKTDADYIVCAHIQVVYAGVNLTSPDACAQTTYS